MIINIFDNIEILIGIIIKVKKGKLGLSENIKVDYYISLLVKFKWVIVKYI